MQVTEQLGPFLDARGVTNKVVVIALTTTTPIAFAGAAAAFGVLPVVGAPASATDLTLGAGSIWFEASLLVPASAAGSFTGFLIADGTLTASAPLTLQAGVYVAPAGTTLTLTATLAPPAAAVGTPPNDLTAATIHLPKTVTIRFTQTGATIEALGSAGLTLYGTTLGLTRSAAPPQALDGFPAILVPCKPSAVTFDFTTTRSAVLEPSGAAPIHAAGWALPVAVTSIAALGKASGAGFLALQLGAGAALTCAARRGKAAIGSWLIGVDPAELFVIVAGTGPTGVVPYTLWPSPLPAGRPSTIEWINPRALTAGVFATPGHELLVVAGQTTAFLDRPLAADGGALPMAGGGLLLLDTGATTTNLTILGQPATPPTEAFSLALENALIGVHAPSLFLVLGPIAGPAATRFTRATVTLELDARWLLPTLPDPYAASFEPQVVLDRGALGSLWLTLSWSGSSAVGPPSLSTLCPLGRSPRPRTRGRPSSRAAR